MRVLLILFLALMTIIPLGCDEVQTSEDNARAVMPRIYSATMKFRRDEKRVPSDVIELVESGILTMPEKVAKEWNFYLNWPDDIYAMATDDAPEGVPDTLLYIIPDFW